MSFSPEGAPRSSPFDSKKKVYKLSGQLLCMNTHAYQLGLQARNRGAWFHAARDYYMAEGLLTEDLPTMRAFYTGYWGDGFDVQYENGRLVLVNKDRSPVSRN
jgi:hypothetical protein